MNDEKIKEWIVKLGDMEMDELRDYAGQGDTRNQRKQELIGISRGLLIVKALENLGILE